MSFAKRQIKQKKTKKLNSNKTNIARKFGKTIMIESILAICVLLVASLLTITSPNPMNISSMSMGSSFIFTFSCFHRSNGRYVNEQRKESAHMSRK